MSYFMFPTFLILTKKGEKELEDLEILGSFFVMLQYFVMFMLKYFGFVIIQIFMTL